MSIKFGRTYFLSIQGRSGKLISASYPLTMKFSISHAMFSGANVADIQIYNLGAASQKEIYWDQWIKDSNIPIQLYAGYDNNLSLIFTGSVVTAYTDRSGQDLITYINAFDGGYGIRNGVLNLSIPAKTPLPTAFAQAVTQGLPGVSVGAVRVTNLPPVNAYAQILHGSAWQEIHDKLVPPGGQCFIYHNTAYLVGMNDSLAVPNDLGILSAGSGLLNIPKREGNNVSVTCLFEPRMQLGQTLTLMSSRASWTNGNYQIIGFKHQGTISGVESGDATTEITLFSLDVAHYPTTQGVTGPASEIQGTQAIA